MCHFFSVLKLILFRKNSRNSFSQGLNRIFFRGINGLKNYRLCCRHRILDSPKMPRKSIKIKTSSFSQSPPPTGTDLLSFIEFSIEKFLLVEVCSIKKLSFRSWHRISKSLKITKKFFWPRSIFRLMFLFDNKPISLRQCFIRHFFLVDEL